MKDIGAFGAIAIGAVITVLAVAVYRSKKALPILPTGPIWSPLDTAATVKLEPMKAEIIDDFVGPRLPGGVADILYPSKLDYITNVYDRAGIKAFWDRTKGYNEFIYEAAQSTGLSNNFIRAVMYVESSGKNEPVNSSGCTGLMQLTIGAAHDMGYSGSSWEGLMDPRTNIIIGAKYLAHQINRYSGNVNYALAAYNWGCVHRWAPGVTPIPGVGTASDWSTVVVPLYKKGSLVRFGSNHTQGAYGPIANQDYVNRVNYALSLFNQTVLPV